MATKSRRERRKCQRKIRYATLIAASAAARSMTRDSGGIGIFHGYRCPGTGHFHVGHARVSVMRRALSTRSLAG